MDVELIETAQQPSKQQGDVGKGFVPVGRLNNGLFAPLPMATNIIMFMMRTADIPHTDTGNDSSTQDSHIVTQKAKPAAMLNTIHAMDWVTCQRTSIPCHRKEDCGDRRIEFHMRMRVGSRTSSPDELTAAQEGSMRSAIMSGLLVACMCFGIASANTTQARSQPVASAQVSSPRVITVSTNLDEVTPNGECSLREAVLAVNSGVAIDTCPGGAGPVTIMLPAGNYSLTLRGWKEEDDAQEGDLDIKADLTLLGAGPHATSLIGANERIFDVREGNVTLAGLRVHNGLAQTGGGIRNLTRLSVINSDIRANTTRFVYPDYSGGTGGGIANSGTLTLTATRVTQNTALGCGLSRLCWAQKSTNNAGGGIYNSGTLILTSSLVDNNVAEGEGLGAGIHNAESGTMIIVNSTVSNNRAAYLSFSPEFATVAGIFNSGELTLNNTTIADNVARGVVNLGRLHVTNTILARNTDSDCSGLAISGGYNLVQDLEDSTLSPCAMTGDVTTSIFGVGAGLDLRGLQDNGGPTPTVALLPESKAIDAGSPAMPGSAATACAIVDQRNATRPADGDSDGIARCDIGAYERQPGEIVMRTLYISLIAYGR